MANGTFEDLMAILEQVPGNKEERTSLRMTLADEIYKERRKRGLTQAELAEMIKSNGESINQATISKIETAENDILISTYEKVTDVLGIRITVTGPSDFETLTLAGSKARVEKYNAARAKRRADLAERRAGLAERRIKEIMPQIVSPQIKSSGPKVVMRKVPLVVQPYSNKIAKKRYKGNYNEEMNEFEPHQ